MLGGTCCTPIALRVSISTIEIFRKQVQIIINIGTSESAPRNSASIIGLSDCISVIAYLPWLRGLTLPGSIWVICSPSRPSTSTSSPFASGKSP